jgi:predicted RNase H-like HicB family nuclease
MHIVAIIHKNKKTYGVMFPDLPGCISAGETAQDALANATEAVSAHLSVLAEHGDPIPVPRPVDVVRADPEFQADFVDHVAVALVPYLPPGKSVRVNISLDEHLLAAIDRAAEAAGSTRSGLLAEAARRRLADGSAGPVA